MSGDDAFDRAVRALRETGEASDADVARTRMRIMETMHRGERRGRRTFWVLLPIAAVLAGSTALAKNSDVVRRVWTVAAEAVGIVEPSEKPLPVRSADGRGARKHAVGEPATETLNGASAPTENAAGVDTVPVESAPPAENSPPAETAAAREALPAAPRRPRRSPVPEPAAQPEVPKAPETVAPEAPSATAVAADEGEAASLQLYKQAYRLHFVEQRYAAALVAWDDYLRAAPAGRLVVEARYNRGIALARLGRRVEAEAALAPFARGEVSGGYRAREARELLDALNGSSR